MVTCIYDKQTSLVLASLANATTLDVIHGIAYSVSLSSMLVFPGSLRYLVALANNQGDVTLVEPWTQSESQP